MKKERFAKYVSDSDLTLYGKVFKVLRVEKDFITVEVNETTKTGITTLKIKARKNHFEML